MFDICRKLCYYCLKITIIDFIKNALTRFPDRVKKKNKKNKFFIQNYLRSPLNVTQ